MDHLIYKAVIAALCVAFMLLVGVTTTSIIGMLIAVTLTAFFEITFLPFGVRVACPLLYCLLTLFIPELLFFLPLAASDLFRLPWLGIRGVWLLPLLVAIITTEQSISSITLALGTLLLGTVGCVLVFRSDTAASQIRDAYRERDTMAMTSLRLETLNHDMQEQQLLDLRLATLNERSRIAREIHDNVGHLLTRSVLQVKALMVVHAQDEQLALELEQVSATLNSAFETVRTSVHDLHDESYSLHTQLLALAQEQEDIKITVEFQSRELPPKVAYSFLAIVREALSNTERHSNATAVEISVVEFPGLYQLTVQDNGVEALLGFSPVAGSGMGLSSMEERARSLGGIFRISYDKGCKVFVTVPKTSTKQ